MKIDPLFNTSPVYQSLQATQLPEKRHSNRCQKDTLYSSNSSCLGWLSSLISSIFKYISSCFYKENSKKPSKSSHRHRTVRYPSNFPLAGINNKANDCCFNATLGGAAQIPSWRAALSTIPACENFFEAYDKANEEHKPVNKAYSHNVRMFLHIINPGYGWHRNEQEDTILILNLLFNYVQQHHPELSPPGLQIKRIASDGDTVIETLPYLSLQRNPDDIEENFLTLFRTALFRNSEKNQFNIVPDEILVDTAPYYIINQAKKQDEYDPKEKKITKKLLGTIDTLNLSNVNAQYECDYFVRHIGSTPKYGHYICARKISGQWYEVDDEKVTLMEKDKAIQQLRHARLIHYTRLPS
jgi:hypothetical protein